MEGWPTQPCPRRMPVRARLSRALPGLPCVQAAEHNLMCDLFRKPQEATPHTTQPPNHRAPGDPTRPPRASTQNSHVWYSDAHARTADACMHTGSGAVQSDS